MYIVFLASRSWRPQVEKSWMRPETMASASAWAFTEMVGLGNCPGSGFPSLGCASALRVHLRHSLLHAKTHLLTRIVETGNSSFGQALRTFFFSVPSWAQPAFAPHFLPWTLHVRYNVPEINNKERMPDSGVLHALLQSLRWYLSDGKGGKRNTAKNNYVSTVNPQCT